MQAPLLSGQVRGELPDQSACAHDAASPCGNLQSISIAEEAATASNKIRAYDCAEPGCCA